MPKGKLLEWVKEHIGEDRMRKDAGLGSDIDINDAWIGENVRIRYAIPEPIGRMMKGLNKENIDVITKLMGSYNRVFRMAATTWRLPFVVTNFARDVWNGVFLDRLTDAKMSRLGGLSRGVKDATLDAFGIPSEVAKSFKWEGGGFGGIATSLPKEVRVPMRLLNKGQKIVRAGKDGIFMPFTVVEKAAHIGENAVRMGHFQRAMSAGLSKTEASFLSRDLTVDFGKAGDVMRVFNMWVPFLNASLQGNVNYLRYMRDKPGVAMGRMMYLLALPYVGLKTWNMQFADDKDTPRYLKDGYWRWRVPDFEALKKGEFKGKTIKTDDGRELPIYVTIRKSELAAGITHIVDRIVDYGLDQQKERMPETKDETLSKVILSATMGSFGKRLLGSMPPAISTPLEATANWMFWADSPIVPEYMTELEPKYQARPSTTNLPRRAGEIFNLSPAKIEYVMTSSFPAGRQMLAAASPLFKSDKPGAQNYGISSSKLEMFSKYVPVVKAPSFKESSEKMYAWKEKDISKQKTASFLVKQADKEMLLAKTPEEIKKADKKMQYVMEKYKGYITYQMRLKARQENQKRIVGEGMEAKDRVFQKFNKPQKKRYVSELIEEGAQ
jgi:hypothetical protein